MEIVGWQKKTVTVDGPNIHITRPQSFLATHMDKTIPIRNITAVHVQKPSLYMKGNIEFSIPGGNPDPASVENTIMFEGDHNYEMALKIKKYVEDYGESLSAAQPISAADEILKFKNLMDLGIITKEEFEGKKKQLLGL